jgi:coenzyme F420-reducing hydrogenase gamma subunit
MEVVVETKKPRLGFFKYSCCAGCEFQFIFFQKYIVEVLDSFDFIFCKMVSSGGTPEGPFDIALVEGTITESWQIDELKKIREKSKNLFAIGSCAVNGGIPAIKSTQPELEIEKRVYQELSTIHSIRPNAISAYVKIDGEIKGCPPGERDLYEALTSVLLKKKPDFLQYSVCVECKIKGNICVLVSYNMPCMGPVTGAGCGALCPSHNRACYSCWGPMKQANASALARQFEVMGLAPEDILRRFTLFGSVTTEFRKASELYED